MTIVRMLIGTIVICWLTNCGGEANDVISVSVVPPKPLVFDLDREFIVGIDFITFPAPLTQFQLRFDNQGNSSAITIIGAIARVDGFKGRKTIAVDPLKDLVNVNPTTGQFSFLQRTYIVEIKPYQAAYCMDKVTYLKRIDHNETCSSIALDDTNNILINGVSAAATVEPSGNSNVCCPVNQINNLQNTSILLSGLQDIGSELPPLNSSYQISLDLIGFFGSIANPTSNFRQTINFSASNF